MGYGTYTPETRMDAAELAERTGIPENVIREKFGVQSKPVPGPEDTTSAMAVAAARRAIEDAGIDPAEIDILIYNGGQHKDYPNLLYNQLRSSLPNLLENGCFRVLCW